MRVKRGEDTDRSEREATSLRQELKLRILLQNLLLTLSVGLYTLVAGAAAIVPASAWPLAAAYNVAILAATLQWCHHGIRTVQIRRYLVLNDVSEDGWERWLQGNRPPTLLGSRWMISTKGVFLGLGMAIALLAAFVSPRHELWLAVASIVLWVATALFLFTNPKE